jgi:hypothetical protein
VSERALLTQALQDLVTHLEALQYLVRKRARNESETKSDEDVARRAHLQAMFVLMHSQFLLAGLRRRTAGLGYPRELRKVKAVLADVDNLIMRKGGVDAGTLNQELDSTLTDLPRYRSYVQSV